jgi:hypothetical protein
LRSSCRNAAEGGLASARQKIDPWNFARLLCFGSVKEGEKNSREQPKELWVHGRAMTTAMGMPQPKRNENRYLSAQNGIEDWPIDSGEYQI